MTSRTYCDGMRRRDFIRAGAVGSLGLGLADLLRWEARNPGDTPPTTNSTTPGSLDMAQALRLSLRQRPDLFTRAGMNAL